MSISLYVEADSVAELQTKVSAAMREVLPLEAPELPPAAVVPAPQPDPVPANLAVAPEAQATPAPVAQDVNLAAPAPRRRGRPAATPPAAALVSPAPVATATGATAAAGSTPAVTPTADAAQSTTGAASSNQSVTAAAVPAGQNAAAAVTPAKTVDDCRAAMAAVNEKHGMQAVVDILACYGAQRASMLKAEQYDAFIVECNAEAAKEKPVAANAVMA